MTSVKQEDKSVKPKAFTIKYKRPRGSRACQVCRSRKVRCDAEIHIPCTNCITFGCDCVLPEQKRRGSSKRKKENEKEKEQEEEPEKDHETDNDVNEPILNISQTSIPPSLTSTYKNRPSMHKKELLNSHARASLTFLGLSSIGSISRRLGDNHVQLTEDVFGFNSSSKLDSVELEILKLRGAFLLPSYELSLDLINSYFEHVHPLMPCINRTEFMKKFNDPNDSPSLMVLQAVLLMGCRVSENPLLYDADGSKDLASITLFRRAKALYETNFESDPVSIIQTLILIGSYWEGPEDVTKNSFYWNRVAVGLAQGFGFQRDVSNSTNLSANEKKIWRRIWWCLFEKDRNVAIAFGRPTVIDLSDCDAPMLTIDDFNEDEIDDNGQIQQSPYPVNETQALYFIHLVKLAEITGIIVKHQYSVKSEKLIRKNKFSIIQHCDMLMGIWFTNLPPQLVFSLNDPSTQNFYSCLLNVQYYNRLYLIHRSNLVRMAKSNTTNPNNYKYPSWGISFQAARMISIVLKILLERDQIKYCPVVFVYVVFSALMMLIYHVDSTSQVISSAAADSLFISRAALRELGKYWPVAVVLTNIFDKYANDKIKRAKVIEIGSKIADLAENDNGDNNVMENNGDNGINNGNDKNTSINNNNLNNEHSISSSNVSPGVQYGSPYENVRGAPQRDYANSNQQNQFAHHPLPNQVQQQQQQQQQTQQQSDQQNQQNQPMQLQQHLQQGKSAFKIKATETKPNESSPSSTQSFPDISLVTENLPKNPNFFENFEPTQLFPDIKFSLPPTRVQSPTPQSPGFQQDANAGNEQVNIYPQDEITQTPGGTFSTNFMDNSFINMNMQSGLEGNFGDDLTSSLFNLY